MCVCPARTCEATLCHRFVLFILTSLCRRVVLYTMSEESKHVLSVVVVARVVKQSLIGSLHISIAWGGWWESQFDAFNRIYGHTVQPTMLQPHCRFHEADSLAMVESVRVSAQIQSRSSVRQYRDGRVGMTIQCWRKAPWCRAMSWSGTPWFLCLSHCPCYESVS